MPFKFFIVPVIDPFQSEQELNRFLRGHRALRVHKKFLCDSGFVY